jgi:asparagine synthetase B (glutamine-hydrolysing)
LAKEEYVAGAYGIEARYPFLDKQVVQEFLWLDVNLKNSTYKSVLHDYLTQNAYAFIPNQKIGF